MGELFDSRRDTPFPPFLIVTPNCAPAERRVIVVLIAYLPHPASSIAVLPMPWRRRSRERSLKDIDSNSRGASASRILTVLGHHPFMAAHQRVVHTRRSP
jgi:hypothetical protein